MLTVNRKMNNEKIILRKNLLKIRNSLSLYRRAISEIKAKQIASLDFENILSFSSKAKEINLWSLNKKLAIQNRLILPKVVNSNLKAYKVKNFEIDLIKGPFNILEPNEKTCREVSIDNIPCILVPGLGFDSQNYRIGYGKGYYDRFLVNKNATYLGVGFLEQYIEKLPIENHDIKLDHLFLF